MEILNKLTVSGVSDKRVWDALLNQCQKVDLSQTWEIGVARQKCHGWNPCRDIILYQDRPIAIVQTLIKKMFIFGGIAKIIGGPLFINTKRLIPDLKIQVFRFLHRYWSQQHGMLLHIAPCIAADEMVQNQLMAIGFTKTDDEPWASAKTDISLDEVELREKMNRGWRKGLNKAGKNGLTVETDNSDTGFIFMAEQYKQECKTKGITFISPDFAKAVREASMNSKSVQSIFTIKKQQRIGGILNFGYGNTAYGLISWNSPEGRRHDSQRLLIWESMLLFKKMGYRWYDLGGVNEKKWPGITSFKRGVGGYEFVYAGNYKSVPHKLVSRLLNKLIELRNKIK